jgi:hypothetical protein
MSTTAECIHKFKMSIKQPSRSRVKLSGEFACRLKDIYTISGCNHSSPPGPCLMITWSGAASKVKIDNSPALLQDSTGLTVNGELQQLTAGQKRVKGT